MKNTEIKITERNAKNTGLVVNGLSPNTGGKLKSAVLGGLKPSSLARYAPTSSPEYLYMDLPAPRGDERLRAKPY
jgi:hypothetical protein